MSQPAEPRVLVVDDEPNIVDVVTLALRFQGFAVESAGTGGEALAAVSGFRRPRMRFSSATGAPRPGGNAARRARAGAGHRGGDRGCAWGDGFGC
jgi:CheY-like chemotaxis protein